MKRWQVFLVFGLLVKKKHLKRSATLPRETDSFLVLFSIKYRKSEKPYLPWEAYISWQIVRLKKGLRWNYLTDWLVKLILLPTVDPEEILESFWGT